MPWFARDEKGIALGNWDEPGFAVGGLLMGCLQPQKHPKTIRKWNFKPDPLESLETLLKYLKCIEAIYSFWGSRPPGIPNMRNSFSR